MRKLTAKVLILTLIISGMLSGVGPSFKSFATGAFSQQPDITFIDNSVHFSFGTMTVGTAIILITHADTPPILPQFAEQVVPDPELGIYLKTTQPTIGSQYESGSIDISSASLPSGQDYKLEVFIKTTVNELSTVDAASVVPKFYKATVTQPEVVSTSGYGFIAKVTSDSPGTLKVAAINAEIIPTDSDIIQNTYTPAYETPIAAYVPVNVKVTDPAINNPNTSYKVHALFRDVYDNLHTEVRSSTGVVYPDGVRMLDVYYDNGVKSVLTDDRILIKFNKAVTITPGTANFEVSFVKNAVLTSGGAVLTSGGAVVTSGGAVNFNTGIKFNSPMYDYQVINDGDLVVLAIQNAMTGYGIQKIDEAAEFDNGLMKVNIVYPIGIEPQLDSDIAHWSKIIPLNQSIIQIDDAVANQLTSMNYDSKNTPLKSDDEIIIGFSGDVGSDVGTVDSLILDADNKSIGGFIATDVGFIRGTDYTVTSVDSVHKKIGFTPEGVVKLNALQNATLRLKLGNPIWENSMLNPAFHSIYTNVYDTNTLIKELYVWGRAIPNFNKLVYTGYEVVVPHAFKKSVEDLSSCIGAISDSPYALVKTQKVNSEHYKVSVTSPKESSTVTEYIISVRKDNLSVQYITLDGNIISGFDPLKTSYAVTLPQGTTVPNTIELAMENKDITGANIVKTQSGTLPGTLTVTFTITVGAESKVITIAFTAEPTPPPPPLAVGSITLAGNLIEGFDRLKTSYAVGLSPGVTSPPAIGIVMENTSIPEANIVKTQSGTLPGTLTVTYTVTFEGQTRVITIVFTAGPAPTPTPTPTPTPNPNDNVGGGGVDEPPATGGNTTPTTGGNTPPVTGGSAPPPVDTVPKPSTDSTVQITQSLDQLIALPQGASTVEVTAQMSKVSDLLTQSIDPKQLVGVLGQMDNVINKLTETVVKGTELTTATSEQVVKLTESVEGKILQIESPQEALKVAETYLTSLSDLSQKSNLQSQEINKSVEDILSGINKKLGTVTIDQPVTPDKPVEVKTADIQKAIDQQVAFAGNIKNLTDAFFGSTDTRKIQSDVVIAIKKPEGADTIQTKFNPEVVTLLKDSKVSQIALNVEGTVLSIPSENMVKTAEYVMSTKTIQQAGGSSTLEAGTSASPSKIIEFNVFENGLAKDVFAKPIELTFLLADFDLSVTDRNFIGIYKKNEATEAWNVVGGIVDPQRGLVFVKRGSLSQYTVMKSKKSFSDSDTSWAKNEIDSLLSKGVVESTTKFEPKALLTRAEFASWIAKAYGLTASTKGTPFTDLKKTDKNYDAVAAVYELGIINGKSKNQFDPNGNITADEMAVIIGKTLVLFNNKQDTAKVKSKHLDTLKSKSVASWAEGDQALLLELGLSGANSFAKGTELITKETAAATFAKFYNS